MSLASASDSPAPTTTDARNSSVLPSHNQQRPAKGKWSQNIEELISKGRRNSAAKLLIRFRSGSLPGWIGGGGGGASFSSKGTTATSPTPVGEPDQFEMLTTPGGSSASAYLVDHQSNQPPHGQTAAIVKVYPQLHYYPEMLDTLKSGVEGNESDFVSAPLLSSPPKGTCVGLNGRNGGNVRGLGGREPCLFPGCDNSGDKSGGPDVSGFHTTYGNVERNPEDSSPLTSTTHHYSMVQMKSFNETESDCHTTTNEGNDAIGIILSALYGKLLVVMGIAFPMSEVISTYIPPSFYDGFYLYLYFGSITFMICIYGNILRQKATRSVQTTLKRINTRRTRTAIGNSLPPDVTSTESGQDGGDSEEGSCSDSPLPSPDTPQRGLRQPERHNSHDSAHDSEFPRFHFGSFYLRMGAVAFGIGSMIYSGLEFGQFFELDPHTKCNNFMIALTPAVRMIFTFMQMYFIFLNSKMAVAKLKLGAKFGLMHMIGTNLCVWLNVLIQETRHEILNFYNPENGTITFPSPGSSHGHGGGHFARGGHGHHGHNSNTHPHPHSDPHQASTLTAILTTLATTTAASSTTTLAPSSTPSPMDSFLDASFSMENFTSGENSTEVLGALLGITTEVHHRMKRGLRGPYSMYECRRSDIMGALVQNASPFLFPCTIEYSLICAAILYVMWKSLAKTDYISSGKSHQDHPGESHMHHSAKRSPHNYSVDCSRANKGLFFGIFFLVMTIISLILFFVLVSRPGYQAMAVLEINITELVLYTITTISVLIGMCQMRELRFVRGRNLELDNILLIVAQTGSFIYNLFTIIGGHFTLKNKKSNPLVLVTALASLVQLLIQTLFILDASKRSASTPEQIRRKPGREIVTFLLVTNLAMWSINTLEKSRADSHPVQLQFYGVWAWTIITHISMPLAIFYRFHSTVCLCEIWKRAYKIKHSIAVH